MRQDAAARIGRDGQAELRHVGVPELSAGAREGVRGRGHGGRVAGGGAPGDRRESLGERRGVLLVQLPPSLAWDARVARTFLGLLRDGWDGPVACEPRHASWFDGPADRALARLRVTRTVTVIDAATNHVIGSIPTGKAPTSIAVLPNGHQAYVTDEGDGTIEILNIAK